MTTERAYLDWNASAPLLPEARAAMLAAMAIAGNPSSIHAEGRAARAIVEQARARVAALAGGEAENVVFTSGATEAISAVLARGLSGCCGRDLAVGARRIIGATEHAAVLAAAGEGAEVAPVDGNGRIDAAPLAALLAEGPPALVMIQLANNETGVVQDIPALARMVHAAAGALVVDAVQGPGRLADLAAAVAGADAVILSAHKFGGPKGVGAIVFRNSRIRLASALISGGGQERGQRGGTENIPGIAGMGAAAASLPADEALHKVIQLRDHFESRVSHIAPDARIVGQDAPRLANTTLFAVPGLAAERALIAFDLDGLAVSSGSACSSGKVKASHVLAAMGEADRVIGGAIRVSIGPATTEDELERCLASLGRQISRIRRREASAA